MARPAKIDNLIYRKSPENGTALRDQLYAFAKDGERVGDLIDRAEQSGLFGSRVRIRQAIRLGANCKGAKFKLEDPSGGNDPD